VKEWFVSNKEEVLKNTNFEDKKLKKKLITIDQKIKQNA
jgi:hypothetical protein